MSNFKRLKIDGAPYGSQSTLRNQSVRSSWGSWHHHGVSMGYEAECPTGGLGRAAARGLRAVSVAIGAGAAIGLALLASGPRESAPLPPHALTTAGEPITIVDGDTVDIGAQRYRLVGHDTPEIYHARCGLERDRGILAAARLIELVRAGEVEVLREDGREKWGRGLARLIIGGRDVAEILIAEGHGRPYDGVSPRRGWCGD